MDGANSQGWRGKTIFDSYLQHPEQEQALVRMSLTPIALVPYLVVAWLQRTAEAYAIVWAFVPYVAFSVATFLAVKVMPAPSRVRLVTATVIDQAALIVALAVGGRIALPLLWGCFWFLVGAGCRYGKRMLALSCAVALAGFAGLMRWEPWWSTNLEAGLGMVLSVAATSLYLAALVNKLEKQAATDPLTGLSNRFRLERAVAHIRRTKDGEHGQSALLLIDLDGFKEVNDVYGHAVGDALLQRFASALQARVRRGDTLARLGGDEFMVLARHVHGQTGARTIAENVHTILRDIESIDGYPVSVSASIGVCMLPASTGDAPLDMPFLLRQADSAMYRAKALGVGQTVFSQQASLGPDGLPDHQEGEVY